MKTIYQKPETTTTKLVMEQMILTASDPKAQIDTTITVEANEIETRRSFSVWDDEE